MTITLNSDQLEQIKVDLDLITVQISRLVNNMNNLGKNLDELSAVDQPEEFQEAAVVYSRAKNELTAYLLTVASSLSLTLLDVIAYVQSTPKARLWVPENVV